MGDEKSIDIAARKPEFASMLHMHAGHGNTTQANDVKGSEESMVQYPHFFLMLHVSNSSEAFELYHQAFGAVKISEDVLPLGDVYIMMDVNGFPILLRPGEAGRQLCCVKFATEADLRKTYDLLTREGTGSFADAHWTSLLAFVTDKYGVDWQFSV